MRTPQHSEARRLRAEGRTLREIAATLKISPATALRWSKGPATGIGLSAMPWAGAEVDLASPQTVLAQLDRVYIDVRERGYTAAASLQARILRDKLEGMRRIEPPPCQDHVTVEQSSEWQKHLIATFVDEIRRHFERAETDDHRNCWSGSLRNLAQG